jgi:nucleoside-diphosphate-sugar epimerase
VRVFVAGGTGVLGRRAVRLMVQAGHDVTVVTRSPEREAEVREAGAVPVAVDIFDAAAVRKAVDGHEVVANLATHIPKASRMAVPSAWKDNDRIRTEGSRNLADAALDTGARRFIQESIAFLYADAGDQWITETSEVLAKANLTTALSAEANAARVAESGATGVILRFAQFYGPDSHTTLDTVRFAKRRVAGGFGKDTYVSSITTDDAASAVLAALSAPSGLYNVVDDEPVTRLEYCAVLAAAVGAKPAMIPPRRMARLAGGRAAILSRSQRVSNTLFRETAGWTPATPSVREGWPAVVAAIKAGAKPA